MEAGVLAGLGHAGAEGRVRFGGNVSGRGADVREVSHRHGLAGGEGSSGADQSGGDKELHVLLVGIFVRNGYLPTGCGVCGTRWRNQL